MYVFSTLAQDPYARWHAQESGVKIGADALTLATYDPKLQARSPLELPGTRSFPAVGLASFHTALGDQDRDISFLMRSSPYGGVSHGHADQNAYVIEAFGRSLAIATGYYPWYGSPHHDQWTRATRAVNSILVNGQGQAQRRWEANGRLTGFDSSESGSENGTGTDRPDRSQPHFRSRAGYDYAEGEAAPAYAGRLERFRRHVVHVRPGSFVVFDDLRAAEPARFQWLLHACHRIDVAETNQLLRIVNAPAAMNVHLLLPDRVEITQTNRYEPEPEPIARQWENTWHLTAGTTVPASSTKFLAVMLVHRQGQESTLPKVELLPGTGAVGVRLTAPDGAEDTIGFRTDQEAPRVTCGDIEITGRVLAQGKNKDARLVRRFAHPR
jgi:hypothetical protein